MGGDFDSLDVYHELTGFRPWGQWSGDELKAAIREYGDAAVTDVLRAMYGNDSDRDTLWKRAKTQLAKNADRQREEGRANGKHRPKAHAMTDEERTAALAEIPGGLL